MSKQYGLIKPGEPATKENPRPFTRPKVFDESSSDSDGNGDNIRPPPLKRLPKSDTGPSIMERRMARDLHQKALAEDPTVFQYDELYDEMNNKREEAKKVKSLEPKKPKYIDRLMKMAERRKMENELRLERQVQKEREAEGEQFKDKEAFVTSAYRKKLEEMRELQERNERDEYLESIGDATKQKDGLDSFYRHFFEQQMGDSKELQDGEEQPAYKPIKSNKPVKKRVYRQRNSSNDDDDEEEEEGKRTKAGGEREELSAGAAKQKESTVKESTLSAQRTTRNHLSNNIDADSDFSIDDSSSESETEMTNPTMPKDEKDLNYDERNMNPSNNTSLQMQPNTVALQFATLTKETDASLDTSKKSENRHENEAKEENESNGNENTNNESESNVQMPKRNKADIWLKRTVGEVFEEAVKRYQARKALRQSYGKG